MIGRAVVVHRRTGRGLAPLWVWIGIVVLTFVVSFIEVGVALAAVAPMIQQYSGN
jgi:hypothetical protein